MSDPASAPATSGTAPRARAFSMERWSTGEVRTLPVERWAGEATAEERALLRGVRPPVLDVGCGPGRITVALGEAGLPALGIDLSPAAVHAATGSGAAALERSVFDPLPGEGRWATVLLLDGNVGIGGDPVRLLRRLRHLVDGAGVVVVEVEPPGRPLMVDRVRLRGPDDDVGPWFDWAWVGADAIRGLAARAGAGVCTVRRWGGRWFAHLGAGAPADPIVDGDRHRSAASTPGAS